MPRWKNTEQLIKLSNDGEIFDENWMNYNSIYQYMPKQEKWKENRRIKFEDVYIWEVIAEVSGPVGVYAAWQPYAPYFIVMKQWSIDQEFWGIEGEKKLQQYMIDNNINFSLNKIWVESEDMWLYLDPSQNKLIIP